MSDTNKGPDEAKIKVRTNPLFNSDAKTYFILEHVRLMLQFTSFTVHFTWAMLFNLTQIYLFIFIFQALLDRTGYTLDVTTGQRKYGGPPPESAHSGAQPTIGTEVSTGA